VPPSPHSSRRPAHRRQWTHSNFDGTRELRLHRSPEPVMLATAEEDEEEEEEVEEQAEENVDSNDAEEQEEEEATQVTRSRRKAPTPAKQKATPAPRGGRKLAAELAAAAVEEEEEEEQEDAAEDADDADALDAMGQGAMEVDEESESDDSPAASASAAAAAAASGAAASTDDEEEEEEDDEEGEEQDDEDGEEQSEDDDEDEDEDEEDGDDWVHNMADWAASEMARRLKPAAASAAAAAAQPAAAAAAGSLFGARRGTAGSNVSAAAAAAPLPQGFVRKAGVIRLSDSAEAEAAGDDERRAEAPAAKGAPDLLASLSALPAAGATLAPVNPLAAAKAAKKSSTAAPTAGKDWFNFSRPSVITPEMKTDLKLLSLRAYLDPKKFFKKEGGGKKKKGIVPTFFQMGTVVAGATDFYSSRLTRGERTAHFADELVDPTRSRGAVKKTKHYLKRKVMELQQQNAPAPRTFNKKRKAVEDAAKRPGSGKKRK